MVDEEQIRRAALALPATAEKPSYGTPGFRVRDRLFARIGDDGTSLVLFCADESEKAALVDSRPEVFFSTRHYHGRAMVLARLAALDEDLLTDVLTESWRVRAPRGLVAEFDAGPHPDR